MLEQIDRVSKVLACMIGIATLSTFFGRNRKSFEAVSTALVYYVATIPEGLEDIVALVYSWATINMVSKKAIIRALPAVPLEV